jgi:hypothetical protein
MPLIGPAGPSHVNTMTSLIPKFHIVVLVVLVVLLFWKAEGRVDCREERAVWPFHAYEFPVADAKDVFNEILKHCGSLERAR